MPKLAKKNASDFISSSRNEPSKISYSSEIVKRKYEPLLTIMYIKRKLHFQTTIIIPTHFYEQTPTPHEQFFPPQSKLYCE